MEVEGYTVENHCRRFGHVMGVGDHMGYMQRWYDAGPDLGCLVLSVAGCWFSEIVTCLRLALKPVRRPWGACWMVAEGGEGENPLPFSLTAPKRGGGVGGVGGGIPASFPSRSPPPKQPFQPTPTPSPGSHQEVCEKS